MLIPEAVNDRMTINQALATVLPLYAEREALISASARVTFKELGEKVNALAGGLHALGLQPGDKVALILPNSVEFIYAFFAIPQAGGVVVPLNPLFKQRELRHMLGESEVSAAILVPKIYGNDLLATIQGLRQELPALRHLITLSEETPEGCVSFSALLAAQNPLPPEDLRQSDDLCALLYTSGTTGIPKAVMHSHHSFLATILTTNRAAMQMPVGPALQQFMARYGARYGKARGKPDRSLIPLPMYAIAGPASFIPSCLEGNTLLIQERFNPMQTMELIEREHATNLTLTPSMAMVLLDLKDLKRYDTSSLLRVNVSTASVPPELAQRVRDAFDAPVFLPFGATETGGAATISRVGDTDESAFNTVGSPLPGVQMKVVDGNRQQLPAGEVGELACKREGVTPGYYKAPEATASVFDQEGWYYTGDLAVISTDGTVRIVGRKKDVIIRGGMNIYPLEIENVLMSRPEVNTAAVVGVKSKVGGERVWAFLTLKPGAQLTPTEVLKYCRNSIAAYKVPDEVRILESLPLTPTGKVQKFMLRDLALNETA